MHADDNRDRNRNPESKTVARQQGRADGDQGAFSSEDDPEELASPFPLGCCVRIINVGHFFGGHKPRGAKDQQNDRRYDACGN